MADRRQVASPLLPKSLTFGLKKGKRRDFGEGFAALPPHSRKRSPLIERGRIALSKPVAQTSDRLDIQRLTSRRRHILRAMYAAIRDCMKRVLHINVACNRPIGRRQLPNILTCRQAGNATRIRADRLPCGLFRFQRGCDAAG
jgi:hypothetical protein